MSDETTARPLTVLLVEDDKETRKVLTKHLTRVGFEVTDVDAAEHVLVARQTHGRPFDVVVSDVHLPGMSGIDLASLLLSAAPDQSIVLITGDPSEALAREALSRGPVTYLLKPFQLFELESAVRQAVAARRNRGSVPVDPGGQRKGEVPQDLLRWVDLQSYAGAGHAARVAGVCELLSATLIDVNADGGDLNQAAHAHELGLLMAGATDPIQLAQRSALMLEELGAPSRIVRAVRHMHERWDGSGGPDLLKAFAIPTAATVLSVADALDHYTAAWVQAGMRSIDAVDRAIGLVMVQQETVFSPAVVRVAARERAAIREICGAAREAPVQDVTLPVAARLTPTVASSSMATRIL